MIHRLRFQTLAFLLTGTVAALAGCTREPGRPPTYAVAGKVLNGNKPVANATIVFHPADPTPDAVKPRGTTRADGTFTLTTYDGNDGAPAGEYRVTVEQWLAGRPDDGPSNRLNPKLSKPDSSGLRATVSAAPTELKPFDVKK